MDVLSDVLATVRLQSTVLGRLERGGKWGLRLDRRPFSMFHLVLKGSCWLQAEGDDPREAHEGDVLLLPGGHAHALRDAPGSPVEPFDHRHLRAASGKASTHILCGHFRFEDRHTNLILSALPAVVHVHDLADEVAPWLGHTLELISHESRSEQPGARTAITGLCDALFVYVVRSYLSKLSETNGNWLRALADSQIGAALELIHGDPKAPWTVPLLAARVGMSRSAFAARFARLLDQSPLQYLIEWRLRKAAMLLRESRLGIAEIAAAVGYEAEAAFHKAFKRTLGVTPGAYRDGARREPALARERQRSRAASPG